MKAPNLNYEKFFEKFIEIENTDCKNWSKTGVLAYFCKKYKDQYNIEYEFKFNAPQPSKSFEVFQINKLCINLSSDPIILKDYIDWIFENKVKKSKRRLTSISFLTNEYSLKDFKTRHLRNQTLSTIDRATRLPEKLINKIKTINENILTYGDLAFMMQSQSSDCEKIKLLNLDLSFLSRVV